MLSVMPWEFVEEVWWSKSTNGLPFVIKWLNRIVGS